MPIPDTRKTKKQSIRARRTPKVTRTDSPTAARGRRYAVDERSLNLHPQSVHVAAIEMKRLTSIARAAGLLCASFVFSEPRLTQGQERLAQRIRRTVRLMSEAGQLK